MEIIISYEDLSKDCRARTEETVKFSKIESALDFLDCNLAHVTYYRITADDGRTSGNRHPVNAGAYFYQVIESYR